MTNRSRRQTRHLRLGQPLQRQPYVHNRIVRMRKAMLRVNKGTYTLSFTRAMRPLPEAANHAGGGMRRFARSMYYDRDGRPVDTAEWAVLFENNDYKRVAYDLLGPQEISTVWLGIDHNWDPFPGPPIIFETMIFGGDYAEWTWRYHTEVDALLSHAQIVSYLKLGLTPDGEPADG